MIRIKIIALGKLKDKYLQDAAAEFLKRLSAYAKIDMVEITPVRLPESPSQAEISKALDTEAEMIMKKISSKDYVTALCIEGKQPSSEQLSAEISTHINGGDGSLVYIIGSSYGLSDKIKKKADERLSFGKMTFAHQLFRIMLLEQLYRSFKIYEGSKYHK